LEVQNETKYHSSGNIGIALSGGGSRAIAFHLGCLRTLHKHGILDDCAVLSCVSGGSIIGAAYVTHDGSFDSFEQKIVEFLKKGLFVPTIKTAFTSSEGAKVVLCCVIQLFSLIWRLLLIVPLWFFAKLMHGVLGIDDDGYRHMLRPHRFASRTTLIAETLDRMLFHGATLKDLEWKAPRFVAIATELRTGSAFYFSPIESGCWRFGKLNPDQIRLSKAVAASAAYPLFLPALDETFSFNRTDGSARRDRVTLTDGGVYDNLGLSPLWPDRDPKISVQFPKPDTIIACRAGYGLKLDQPSLFWVARMKATFFATFERAQNANIKRLFDLTESGRLKRFLLPYLGQSDHHLATPPKDLIRREDVDGYPTDFFAMSDEWIGKLSKRGEQVTLAVLQEHHPELLRT
jgi:NTE family protein